MTEPTTTAESFGRDVLGPIVAEFCVRLWGLGSMLQQPQDFTLLFCARGGLRMQLAYEHFLASTGLRSPVKMSALMVSRVAAIRPALMRTVHERSPTLLPWAETTISYEFAGSSVAAVALATSGVAPAATNDAWGEGFSPTGFAALLAHQDGRLVVEALAEQSDLFLRHLADCLGQSRHGIVVDTGLYGTTRQLLSEGLPSRNFSSALFAHSSRPGPGDQPPEKTFGLSVQARGYSPLSRRTAVLRYWHFVEWLFEPDLTSVRTFTLEDCVVRSNLEVEGWQDRIKPTPGSAYRGVIDYLDGLGPAWADRVVRDADRGWNEFRRAVVWPDRDEGRALAVGTRSHDFGTDGTWSERAWTGPLGALRGTSMWREGEIARAGSPLRIPLLAVVEAAYGMRHVKRSVVRAIRSR